MRRIIYREDGGVSVITPAPKSRRLVLDWNSIVKNTERIKELYKSNFGIIGLVLDFYLLPHTDKKTIDFLNKLLTLAAFKKEFLIPEPESGWLERVFAKATPEGADFEDIDEGVNPLPSRRFRNAWSKELKGLGVNLSKAKDQVMSELRAVRNQELIEIDGLMAKANEIGTPAEITELKIQRQILRDLPATIGIEAIMTIDELETKYPEIVTTQSLKTSGELPKDYT